MSEKHQCSKTIYTSQSLATYRHQCPRTKTEMEEDKYYCLQHLPSRVKAADEARREAQNVKWDERARIRAEGIARQAELERRAACYPGLLATAREMTSLLQATIAKYVGNGTILTDAEWDRVSAAWDVINKADGRVTKP